MGGCPMFRIFKNCIVATRGAGPIVFARHGDLDSGPLSWRYYSLFIPVQKAMCSAARG